MMENREAFPSSPVCPHLGMKDDPGTSFRYPTLRNYCCHCKPSAAPHLEHQQAYCFQEAYRECPVCRQPAGLAPPPQFRAGADPYSKPRVWLAIAVILIVLLFSWWNTLRSEAAGPSGQVPASSSYIVPVSGAETHGSTATALPQPSKTSLLPTGTPHQPDALQRALFRCRAHVLEIPDKVGDDYFLIHQVRAEESLQVLEVTYVTASEVILALNDSLVLPLKANSILLISPGLRVARPGLPALEPYQVTDNAISIDELAQKLDVDAALLKYYNNGTDTCRFAAGDWLIVPRPRE